MNEDIAGLVERLEAYAKDPSNFYRSAPKEAASTIRALVAETERLRADLVKERAELHRWQEDFGRLQAKLREAVELLKAVREETAALLERYDDHEQSNHPNVYVLIQRLDAVLVTMEKTDG